MSLKPWLAAAIGWWVVAPASGEPQDDPAVRTFVACPVYRDTVNGRKSGCWLATDTANGQRYDVTLSRTKPQLGREILVEGRLSDRADVCGGPVIAPVHVSVLTVTCPRVMLPAEGFHGRRYEVPLGLVLPPADAVRVPPAPPYVARAWAIEFAFDSDFLQYQYSEVILDQIAQYVLAAHPRSVDIRGFAATRAWVVSGHRLAETPQLARRRAELVALALERLGVARALLKVSWRGNPMPENIDDGLADPSKRRVDIVMTL
jgi:hypothetical protein